MARPPMWRLRRVHVTTGPGFVRPWANKASCSACVRAPLVTLNVSPSSARRLRSLRPSVCSSGLTVARFRADLGSSCHPSLAFGAIVALVGFCVDALMRCGEDFGKVGEVKSLDDGKGDGAEVLLRPFLNAANEAFNHWNKFTLIKI